VVDGERQFERQRIDGVEIIAPLLDRVRQVAARSGVRPGLSAGGRRIRTTGPSWVEYCPGTPGNYLYAEVRRVESVENDVENWRMGPLTSSLWISLAVQSSSGKPPSELTD